MHIDFGGDVGMAETLIQQRGNALATPGLTAEVSGRHQHLAAAEQVIELLCIGVSDDLGQGATGGRVLGNIDLAPAARLAQGHGNIQANLIRDQG